MKLLIITQKVDKNDPILGFFHRWIEEFSKHCESIIVICLYKGEFSLPKNVRVLSLGKETGESKLKYIRNFYKHIWNERKNYDKVFVHMNQVYVILGSLVWKPLSKKIALWYTHKDVTFSLKIAVALVDTIFTAAAESFRIKSRKVHVTGHGIDTENFKPLNLVKDPNDFRIISIGRLSPTKGYEFIISAINALKDTSRAITAEFWGIASAKGDDKYVEKLCASIQETAPQRIFLKGPISQNGLNRVLNEAQALVNMSPTGSFDKAVLEAMSAGLPVITSNEAFKGILSDYPYLHVERNGQSLTEALDKLIVMPDEKRNEISDYFRKYVQMEHSISLLIPKLISLLK